ncbi:IS3 family transposase [Escherichia coli]
MYPRRTFCQPRNNADDSVNYIECDYNRWRRHNACGGLSPEQFENQNLT